MRAYIYVGGEINAANITEHPGGEDLVIAADSGWDNALLLGEHPSILMGDFDSIKAKKLPTEPEIYRVPAEKDLTDTQLAAELALQRGATEIVIIGGLSGRLDHTLANLGLLEHLHALGVHAHIADGQNRVRFLRDGSTLIPRGAYSYLSLLPADDTVKGVEIEGVKYPLKKAKLTRRNAGLGVSNELTGNCALIAMRKGGIFIIESCDRQGE